MANPYLKMIAEGREHIPFDKPIDLFKLAKDWDVQMNIFGKDKNAIQNAMQGIGSIPSVGPLNNSAPSAVTYDPSSGLVSRADPYLNSSRRNPYFDAYTGNVTPLAMVLLRLNGGRTPPIGEEAFVFKNIELIDARPVGDTYHVTVAVRNGAPLIIKDDSGMFPSDQLIGQILTLAQ